jgi:hypothetical protein
MELSKIERNRVYLAIKRAGLDPSTCALTENARRRVVNLNVRHIETGSYIEIELTQRTRYFNSVNQYVPQSGPKGTTSYPDWEGLSRGIEEWAREILNYTRRVREAEERARAEEAMPDLWSLPADWEMPKNQQYPNTPFTPQEQAQIASQLREIKDYVKKTYDLTDTQTMRLEERFNQAEEASRRMGRKDWFLLFSGVVLTLIVSDLVPASVVQHVFGMVVHELGHLFSNDPRRGVSGP